MYTDYKTKLSTKTRSKNQLKIELRLKQHAKLAIHSKSPKPYDFGRFK